MPSTSPLPRWGQRAKRLTTVGFSVLGTLVLIGWALRLLRWATDLEAPDAVGRVGSVGLAVAVTILAVSGATWLAAEVRTGFGERRSPE